MQKNKENRKQAGRTGTKSVPFCGKWESKIFGGQAAPVFTLKYFYSPDGMIAGRVVDGKIQMYSYDKRGQLLRVADMQGNVAESYVYDPAGNILSKTIDGKTTTYTYDKANQLVSSTADGKVTHYEYDAAGRLIKEGDKNYAYGWLDKVLSVTENGREIASFRYHNDGQISKAIYGDKVEEFLWDGLALVWRSGVSYVNEPYVTGGNPILSSKDGVMFNDMLGSTLNIGGKTVNMTAFGESDDTNAMYTGKPYIGELGYAFLFRNYRSDYGKWTTSDPLGYPDGWNNFAYVDNKCSSSIDCLGLTNWFRDEQEPYVMGRVGFKWFWGAVNLEPKGWMLSPIEDYVPNMHRTSEIHDAWLDYLSATGYADWYTNIPTMLPAYTYAQTLNLYETGVVAIGYSIDMGNAVYHYVLDAYAWSNENVIDPTRLGLICSYNWLTGSISDLFGAMGNAYANLLSNAFHKISPKGYPE